jgi:predicted PurR-regulated permease PerM
MNTPLGDPAPRRLVPASLALTAAWSWRLLVVGAAIVAGAIAFSRVQVVVVPTFAAGFLCAVLMPVVDRLHGKGLPRSLAAAAVMVTAILVIAGLAGFLIPRTLDQISDLQSSLQRALNDVDRWLRQSAHTDLNAVLDRLRSAMAAGATSATG